MDGFSVPQFSPDLIAAMKRPNPAQDPNSLVAYHQPFPTVNPWTRPGDGQDPNSLVNFKKPFSPAMQPGYPGGPPVTSGMLVGGMRTPTVPYSGMTPQLNAVTAPKEGVTLPTVSGAKVPSPTDDPAALGSTPKPPDLMSYLNPALTRYNTDQAGYQKADEATRINPQATKPKLWERLVGGLIGGVSGNADAGRAFTSRKMLDAERTRNLTLAPWTQRLQQDREAIPAATSAADVAGKQANLNLNTAKEDRERFTATSNAQYKSDIAEIRDEIAKGNGEKAADLLDQRQKELDEKSQHNQDDLAYKNDLINLRQQLLDMREKKVDKAKDHSAQALGAETQKANALKAAHAAYTKATAGLPTDPKQEWTEEELGALKKAKDDFTQAEQEAEDAYRAKAGELGGVPIPYQDVTKDWGGGAKSTEAKSAELPTQTGPADETALKTGTGEDGRKYGYFKSTGQWMLLPNSGGTKK